MYCIALAQNGNPKWNLELELYCSNMFCCAASLLTLSWCMYTSGGRHSLVVGGHLMHFQWDSPVQHEKKYTNENDELIRWRWRWQWQEQK